MNDATRCYDCEALMTGPECDAPGCPSWVCRECQEPFGYGNCGECREIQATNEAERMWELVNDR